MPAPLSRSTGGLGDPGEVALAVVGLEGMPIESPLRPVFHGPQRAPSGEGPIEDGEDCHDRQ